MMTEVDDARIGAPAMVVAADVIRTATGQTSDGATVSQYGTATTVDTIAAMNHREARAVTIGKTEAAGRTIEGVVRMIVVVD
jgi:hypothetical protein